MNFDLFKPGQRNAITYLEGPLLICAGAGSGKTFTLTQRVAWALMPDSGGKGVPFLDSIDQALVITFTNKAAGEIKDRIRATLRAEGMTQEALAVDGAWISTIHGACNRILHEHALELGLDPAFTLAMDVTASRALDLAIAVVLDRANETADDRYRDLFRAYTPDRVRSMVLEVIGQAACQTAGLDAFDTGPAAPDASSIARELVAGAQEVVETGTEANQLVAGALGDALSKLLAHNAATAANVADVLAGVNLRGLAGKRPATVALKNAVKEARTTLSVAATIPLLQELLTLSREVQEVYRAELTRQGMIDTSDLIRLTLRAFDEHPDLAAEYTQRFKLVMVDEFQDTSQLQIDMIERIVGKARTHLCTVGDAQQSIYRFQGADVQVYLQHKKDMLATQPVPSRREELDDNFRSHGDILAFVRAVCGAPGYFPEAFLDLKAATDGRVWHGSGPRLEMAVTRYGTGIGTSAQAAQAEAAFIASRFAALRAEGHNAADMVLLMGATTGAHLYAQALRDQGFDVVVAGGTKFFATPHVQAALALARVLANPYDSESLLVVLSSDLLPVSSDDLLYLGTHLDEDSGTPRRQNPAYGLVRPDRAPAVASPALAHAAAVLRRAWSKLGRVRPGQLFRETLVDSGWLTRLEARGPEGLAQAADVLKVIRLVDEIAADGWDMPRIAATLAERAASCVEKPGALSQDAVDAVRIMTVHASKGLEFPIVAVANCYTAPGHVSSPATVSIGRTVYTALLPEGFSADGNPVADVAALAHAADPGEFAQQLRLVNAEREYEERKRLFYVAATRASDALIVCVKHRVTKGNSHPGVEADLLAALFPGAPTFPEGDGLFAYGGSAPGRFTSVALADDDGQVTVPEHAAATELAIPCQPTPSALDAHAALQPSAWRSDFFSYTSIAPHDAAPAPARALDEQAPLTPPDDPHETPPRMVVGDFDKATDFGSALHHTCEWLALQSRTPDAAQVEAARERFAAQWSVNDRERLARAFARWETSDVRAQAFAYAHRSPETPFCISLADGFLEGSIDLLCYDDSTRAFIVDYKTGGSPDETADALQDKHILQARCYALAALRDGFQAVEARFVRVEQPARDNPLQPQVVSYSFTAANQPELERIIADARIASRA